MLALYLAEYFCQSFIPSLCKNKKLSHTVQVKRDSCQDAIISAVAVTIWLVLLNFSCVSASLSLFYLDCCLCSIYSHFLSMKKLQNTTAHFTKLKVQHVLRKNVEVSGKVVSSKKK